MKKSLSASRWAWKASRSGRDLRRALAAGGDEGEGHAGPKALGREPGTGLAVTLRRGPHGHYVQKGDGAAGAKPARMSVPGGMAPEDVTLDSALALLGLPREVGVHPESGEPILAGIGRYGPWLRHGSSYAAIPDDDDVLAIGVNRAVVVLADKAVRESRVRGSACLPIDMQSQLSTTLDAVVPDIVKQSI